VVCVIVSKGFEKTGKSGGEFLGVKSSIALVFLGVGFLITLWLWNLTLDRPIVPWSGTGMGEGFGIALLGASSRWIMLLAAFFLLGLDGRLNTWSRFVAVRVLWAVIGLTLLEVVMMFVLIRSIDKDVAPHIRLLYQGFDVALPLAVMLGGQFGSRTLFLLGTAGGLIAAVWQFPKYVEPPLDPNSVEFLLTAIESEKDMSSVLARLEKHPNWVRQVTRALDHQEWHAAILLSLKPSALNENLQERLWQIALSHFARSRSIRDHGENWMPGDFSGIAQIVYGLASIPGPVRERHRADFLAVEDFVDFYRTRNPETRNADLPDLKKVDWAAPNR
jgi:hypothetical protein